MSTKPLILVVEDDTVQRRLVEIMMRKLGWNADVVANAREAIDAYDNKPYDLVVMDWGLPGISGLECAKLIRLKERNTERRRIPIIALTAHAMEGDQSACLEAGMDDYLSKPFTPFQLHDIISRWIGTSESVRPRATSTLIEPKFNGS